MVTAELLATCTVVRKAIVVEQASKSMALNYFLGVFSCSFTNNLSTNSIWLFLHHRDLSTK